MPLINEKSRKMVTANFNFSSNNYDDLKIFLIQQPLNLIIQLNSVKKYTWMKHLKYHYDRLNYSCNWACARWFPFSFFYYYVFFSFTFLFILYRTNEFRGTFHEQKLVDCLLYVVSGIGSCWCCAAGASDGSESAQVMGHFARNRMDR